jgi:hypothetical protein
MVVLTGGSSLPTTLPLIDLFEVPIFITNVYPQPQKCLGRLSTRDPRSICLEGLSNECSISQLCIDLATETPAWRYFHVDYLSIYDAPSSSSDIWPRRRLPGAHIFYFVVLTFIYNCFSVGIKGRQKGFMTERIHTQSEDGLMTGRDRTSHPCKIARCVMTEWPGRLVDAFGVDNRGARWPSFIPPIV